MNKPLTRDEVRDIAMQAITDRTIPEFPAYFFNDDWIVTYDWLADQRQQLMGEIYQLQHRLECLERPWWKRWFR